MEFGEVCLEIALKQSKEDIIGVLCPCYFHFSFQEAFQKALPNALIIPLVFPHTHLMPIIESHKKYFDSPFVFLYDEDTRPNDEIFELVLYGG